MKLLIVVNSYPPDNMVSARRWGNLVPYLTRQGISCTVLVAGDGKYLETKGPSGEHVIRLPLHNSPPLQSSKPARKGLLSRIVARLKADTYPLLFRNFDVNVKPWLAQAASNPAIHAAARDADCILSSYGPAGPLFLGLRLSKTAGKPWVIDIRDSFESKYGNASRVSVMLSHMLERIILRRAALRVTIGENLAGYLAGKYGVGFHAVYNGWIDEDIVAQRETTRAQEPYLYYAGSFYPHRLPALAIVLDALEHFPGLTVKIRLLMDYTHGELQRLLDARPKARIEMLPVADQNTVNSELSGSLAALVLEDISGKEAVMNGTVTGKLLGLLASGISGIAVSSASGEIRSLVGNVNGWHGVNTADNCRGAIASLLRIPPRTAAGATMEKYHMARQTEKLASLLRATLDRPKNQARPL